MIDNKKLETFLYWIGERERVWHNKEVLKLERDLWTNDEIIADVSFCNVYREKDRGTKDNEELIRVFWEDPYYPLYAVMARYFNRRNSLETLNREISKGSDLATILEVFKCERAEGVTLFNSCYMAFVQGVKGDRLELLFSHIFVPMFNDIERQHTALGMVKNSHVQKGFRVKYLGEFLSQQVLMDIAHTPLKCGTHFKDTYTVMGPGSKRGIEKLYGESSDFLEKVFELQTLVKDNLGIYVSAHDIQNCLCEFDKYTRVQDDPNRILRKYKEK